MFEKSIAAFEAAKKVLPGGVDSPVRAFKSVDMAPVFIDHGKGSKLYDIDGKEYIDYVLSWGPLILGHANDQVVKSLQETAVKGTSFGAPSEIETKMAQLVIDRVPSVEMVRFVNSGTEATMSALRLARGVTGRDKILKFEGAYHGHADSLLVNAGSGVATLALPDSPGVPKDVAAETVTVPYNDLDAVQLAFDRYGEELAAIIVEPVSGNMGCVAPSPGFLEGLRDITKAAGSLLIFDEVMTGFRAGFSGAQAVYGVEPDLTCFGKIIGGGLPVGAYGGPLALMEQVAPAGPVYQAGTLSGNPLAMTAGFETLSQLTKESYEQMEKLVSELLEGLQSLADRYGIPLQTSQVGAMFGFFFTDEKVVNFETAKTSDTERFTKFFKVMLEEGIYLAPSQFESAFLSTAHTEEDIKATLVAAEKAFKTIS
ncbi:glutamate-1-semialdehyde 2,1-aminomutase [Lactococcus termiticola]|uniref:Glutamate-1-semialdehyde 2,1-aminomutase n=1 Tax=Lactococcus termiticola TaxID=2169526 RepID=A0A2R5HF33_9LACT|nr:glutamate-1-semialdehyde 2,1-aminomutase [Lactococcus termiticola]GBG96687.1 glutamate-1-semialdehyde aminotransferase [Lactococcus termiticola]